MAGRLERLRLEFKTDIKDAIEILNNSLLIRIDDEIKTLHIIFQERENRYNAAWASQRDAVAAQNTANTIAINKSEGNFTKEIDGLHNLIDTTKETINNQISVITARLDRNEAFFIGIKENRNEIRYTAASVVGIIGGVVGVLALIATIIFGIVTSLNNHSVVTTPGNVPITISPGK